VKEISEVSREQAAGSDLVASSVSEVSQATQATAEEALRAAGDIRRLASMVIELNHSLSRFRVPQSGNGNAAETVVRR
jgi:methyl-accepting chemotaxis protein